MPAKEQYSSCVLDYYGLEPYDDANLAAYIEGEAGCYNGPTKYRAPGYLEGIGLQIGPVSGGVEMVYDFATMQRADFRYSGAGLPLTNPPSWLGASIYFGNINGFKHSETDSVKSDYEGFTEFYSVGVNDALPIYIGTGYSSFWSIADERVRGTDYYINAGVTGSVPIDVNVGLLFYELHSGVVDSYIMPNNRVNAGKLYQDILTGSYSPWFLLGYSIPSTGTRFLRAYPQAMKYVLAYESLHEKEWR
jgi:hypothetical protein